MAATAVISGAEPRTSTLAEALRAQGFEVAVIATTLEDLRSQAAELASGSVDCYVQLPGDIAARGGTVLERVRNFLVDGLLARFEGAETMLHALTDDAVVLLVSGNHPEDTDAPDNHPARKALLETLAACLLIEKPGGRLWPAVVRSDRTDEQIAATARDPGHERAEALEQLRAVSAEVSFDEWRDELLSLVHTYS